MDNPKKKITDWARAEIDSGRITKKDLSEALGIARNTLDFRLERSNWKDGEVLLLVRKMMRKQ